MLTDFASLLTTRSPEAFISLACNLSFISMVAQILYDLFQKFTKRLDLHRTQTVLRNKTGSHRAFNNHLGEFLPALIETNHLSTSVRPISNA